MFCILKTYSHKHKVKPCYIKYSFPYLPEDVNHHTKDNSPTFYPAYSETKNMWKVPGIFIYDP